MHVGDCNIPIELKDSVRIVRVLSNLFLATMGKNEEIVSSLDDMSKEVESRDFQASIYFVKTLTATNVPKDTKYCNMVCSLKSRIVLFQLLFSF